MGRSKFLHRTLYGTFDSSGRLDPGKEGWQRMSPFSYLNYRKTLYGDIYFFLEQTHLF